MSKVKGIHQNKPTGDYVKSGDGITRRELLQRLSPLGKVDLDATQCTGCGLCALECPTGALTVSSSGDAFQLLFKHGICVACNRCVEACPEKCLRMERLLELDNIDSLSVLYKDEIVRCSKCDSPICPRGMMDKLQARVAATGHSFLTQFGLCPACRVQEQSGQLSVSNGHIS